MRALITGGAGFIGSHLADALIPRGWSIVAVDDLSTGSLDNIEHLRDGGKFEFHHDTILNEPLIDRLVSECDVVYHLAAVVGVFEVMRSPARTLRVNLKGAEVVLDACLKHKKRLQMASTSEVYGKHPVNEPLNEESDRIYGPTTKHRWSYAGTKAIDEHLALAMHMEEGLDAFCTRYFNTVGPRQSPAYGMVLPAFVKAALANQPMTVYGTGEQTRCFTHVSDAIRATIDLMESDQSAGEVFNIGNPQEISILSLAETVKEKTGSSSEIVMVPYDKAYGEGYEDMQFRTPDIGKIRRVTGYEPRYSLDQIVDSVIDHMRGRAAVGS